jgi:hypothetical protein
VAAHRSVLASVAAASGSADVLDTYRVLARATAERAMATGRLDAGAAEQLLAALADRTP